MKGNWRYYNHALLPNVAPHEDIDTSLISSGEVWKQNWGGNKPILVRWTDDFDCGIDTGWWYHIKDTPFDINALKAKRRYKIRKGLQKFRVEKIDPRKYSEEIFFVHRDATSAYPLKYRTAIEMKKFTRDILEGMWEGSIVYGAFEKETNEMCAYARMDDGNGYAELSVLKAKPQFEKYNLNAAIIAEILFDYEDKLGCKEFYICDGERNILHETSFQDYLEETFLFRKAYCRLNVVYRPGFSSLIHTLYLFRNLLKKADNNRLFHKINGILKMEEIIRMNKN